MNIPLALSFLGASILSLWAGVECSADGGAVVKDGKWQAVSRDAQPAWQLFDTESDPRLEKDLAAAEPVRVQSMAAAWWNWRADDLPDAVRFPASETQEFLFNGRDLTGWDGDLRYWSVQDGMIRARNENPVPASTYLFSTKTFRSFRLTLEVKQTMGAGFSTMHSAVAVLGDRMADKDTAHGFRGPLVMFCHDWGIWDANRRNRIEPAGLGTAWQHAAERRGRWNRLEILVNGDRIRCAANGQQVFDFTDQPEMLKAAPVALQLHANGQKQEWFFRSIAISANPGDQLVTLRP